jgi:hypothetical protein
MNIFILAIRFKGSKPKIFEFQSEGLLNFLLTFELECPNKEDFDMALSYWADL